MRWPPFSVALLSVALACQAAAPGPAVTALPCVSADAERAATSFVEHFNERRLNEVVALFTPSARVAFFRRDEPVRGDFQAEGSAAIRELFADRFGTGERLSVREIRAFDRPAGAAALSFEGAFADGRRRTLDGKLQYRCDLRGIESLLLTPLAETR